MKRWKMKINAREPTMPPTPNAVNPSKRAMSPIGSGNMPAMPTPGTAARPYVKGCRNSPKWNVSRDAV